MEASTALLLAILVCEMALAKLHDIAAVTPANPDALPPAVHMRQPHDREPSEPLARDIYDSFVHNASLSVLSGQTTACPTAFGGGFNLPATYRQSLHFNKAFQRARTHTA